ncbi:PTS sugar transporter subunit IIA [Candidatus Epulonipiscium viviparus]|uniref:PTS sugar transporter subunit IIA n=1 Tax=Candidatus Epulonipiscium viviparus TaxID=420336 RepID=UPI00016C007B|nr:fructose PTS transporter subunit IIA [Candidatus Epulopiscium viviparus]
MDIRSICNEDMICLNLDVSSKDDAINKMANMFTMEQVTSAKEFIKSIYEREEEMTTGVGNGIALPHGKSIGVKKAGIAIAKFTKPIEWESLDDLPVEIAFMIAVPMEEASTTHLKILTQIASRLSDTKEVEAIKSMETKKQILDFFA